MAGRLVKSLDTLEDQESQPLCAAEARRRGVQEQSSQIKTILRPEALEHVRRTVG